jgi:hypothetical protein
VKNDLIDFVRSLEPDDEIYLYEQDCIDIAKNRRGKQVAQIAAYEPLYVDSENALKQTLYIVSSEDMDAFRSIIYITDNTSAFLKNKINKVNQLNHINYLDCNFALISLGGEDLSNLSEEVAAMSVKTIESGAILNSLKGLLENGRKTTK